jgi:vitamin B12 transporter
MDGRSERSGVEIGASWNASDRVALGMNYTYTHAEEPDSAAELRRPRHAASLHVDYSFLDQRGQLSLAADYGGTRNDVFYPPWPNPSEIVTLRSNWLVDLAAQYRVTPTVNVFARTSNVLDADYEHVYGYRTPGRAVYAGVRVTFGQ